MEAVGSEGFTVTFEDGGKKYKILVPKNIFLSMVVFAKSTQFREGVTGKFNIQFETTLVAVKNLFLWKKSILERSTWNPVDMNTIQDWIYLFRLASQMLELEFFEDFSHWPTLNDMVDHISDLCPEAMILYIEEYLNKCFYPQCHCRGCRLTSLFEDAKSFFAEQSEEDIRQMFSEASQLKDLQFYHDNVWSVDSNEKYNREFRWLSEDARVSWYSRSINECKMIMCYYNVIEHGIKIPDCTQKLTFYEKWITFCTMHPGLAKFIWDGMEREALLSDIGDVPVKRRSRMLKANFEEMCAYIETFRPKGSYYDPEEARLRTAFYRAQEGTPVGLRGKRYYDSKEITLAEARLNQYLVDRKKKQQRDMAEEAKKQYKDMPYTRPEKFKVNLKIVQNGRKSK